MEDSAIAGPRLTEDRLCDPREANRDYGAQWFLIGETFWTHAGAFRCTDSGTRIVVAGPVKSRCRIPLAGSRYFVTCVTSGGKY